MRSVFILAALMAVLACSSPNEPAKADPTVNQQQIVNRLNDDIWPAMDGYSYVQASAEHQRFVKVVAPNARGGELFSAVQAMGRRGEVDADTRASHWSENWKIAATDIKVDTHDTVTVNVCYTYDHSWYERVEDTQHAAGASEATVGLVSIDGVWYLHSITHDHVVPNCTSAKA